MSIPSVKTIAAIEWLSSVGDPTAIAKQVRKVMEFTNVDLLIDHALDTLELDLPNHMYRAQLLHLQLWTIDRLLECHGVECIQRQNVTQQVDLEYCNTGDTYASTVAYDHRKQKFVITSWGDFVEKNDPNGTKY